MLLIKNWERKLNIFQDRAIAPGLIDGPMQQKSVAIRGGEQQWKCQIMRRGTPFEVGSLITWLLCDQSKYITGTVQVIDGGWVC
jgi:NAD(P)-dependent dehydrogenase (short-subunit alcohol dehydrogenase family)